MERRPWTTYAAPALFLAVAIAGWELLVNLLRVPDFILPPPSQVLVTFFTRLPFLWRHTLVTLSEIVLGLIFGVAGGVLLAIGMIYSRVLERTLYPLIIASQMVPVFAIAPLLIVWLGYGLWPKVTVAALICFFPVVINMVDGLRSPTAETIDLFRCLGASERQIFIKLRVPSSMPSFLSSLKVAATLAVVGATIGEWIGSSQGLGYLMFQSNAFMRMDVVFASILALTLVGLLLFAGIRIIERRLLRWRRPD